MKYKRVELDNQEALSYNCINACTYKKVDNNGDDTDDTRLFCFKRGDLEAKCIYEGGSTTEGQGIDIEMEATN